MSVCVCVQVESLEAQLEQSCVKKQLEALQRQLELLEVEKKEAEGRLEEAEIKNEELENRGGRRSGNCGWSRRLAASAQSILKQKGARECSIATEKALF